MILSREEFSLRWTWRNFKVIKETVKVFSVKKLMREIKLDAPFRNHNYLFDGSDFSKVKCDDDVGVNKFCGANVKIEQERLDLIREQILTKTSKPIDIYQDIDHLSIIYVDDGFHRIFCANELNMMMVTCKIKRGHFLLEKAISFKDLQKLMGMVGEMFPKHCDVKKLVEFLEKIPEEKKIHTSIGYGKEDN